MSKNLKSLDSGVLKCAQSQFLKNFGNPNDIIEGCNIIFIIPHNLKEHVIENFAHGYDVPFEDYRVFPVDDSDYPKYIFYCAVDFSTNEGIDVWANTFNLTLADGLCQVFYIGRNEEPFMSVDGAINDSKPGQIFIMTPIESGRDFVFFRLGYNPYEEFSEESFILIAADCTFKPGNISLSGKANLIVNSQLTLAQGAIVLSDYTELDQVGDVYLAPQNRVNIAEGAFVGNIKNLTYHGEWNAETRAWFNGSIYFLNGEPLDPIPNE